MAASRITRKRTNATSSLKAKKFPPPSSSTKSVHEVAILKNEQKEEEEKRDEKPGCDEITDPKRDGNDQSNGEALENHSIPLIHANAAAKTVDANPHLSPPKFSYKKVPSNTIIQPSSSAGNEWTPRHFPPVFSLQQQQHQHHHQHQQHHQHHHHQHHHHLSSTCSTLVGVVSLRCTATPAAAARGSNAERYLQWEGERTERGVIKTSA